MFAATTAATADYPPNPPSTLRCSTGTTRGPSSPLLPPSPPPPLTLSSFPSRNPYAFAFLPFLWPMCPPPRLSHDLFSLSLSPSFSPSPLSFSLSLSFSFPLLRSPTQSSWTPFSRATRQCNPPPSATRRAPLPGSGVGRFCPVWRKPPPRSWGCARFSPPPACLRTVFCTRRLVRTTHPPVRGSSPVHLHTIARYISSCPSPRLLFASPPNTQHSRPSSNFHPHPLSRCSLFHYLSPFRVHVRRLFYLPFAFLLAVFVSGAFSVSVLWFAPFILVESRRVLSIPGSGRRILSRDILHRPPRTSPKFAGGFRRVCDRKERGG